MKKVLLTLAALCSLSVLVHAQHETLFKRTRVVGAFGAPITEFGINNDLNTSVGGGGAVIINSFFIGGYGMGSVDFEQLFDEDNEIDRLELAHGGLWLGFNVAPHKLLHLYSSARIGWGALDIRFEDNVRFEDLDQVFLFTPELGLELNLTSWLRLAGAAGYRWMDGANENRGYTNDDFSGAIASVTLRIGGFGNYNKW